jgi:hypothetical protein
MSQELELPDWSVKMGDPPRITRYVGPEDKVVQWYTKKSRHRYQITVGDTILDLNKQQAAVISQMIEDDLTDAYEDDDE